MKKSDSIAEMVHDDAEESQEVADNGIDFEQSEEIVSEGPSLETLPVQLEVCLAEIELSLSRFRALTAGTIVPLDMDLTAKLDITANGMRIGHGTLVQIGERIGIQIGKWQTEQEH